MGGQRDLEPLEVATRQALRDQSTESARELAAVIVAFRDELLDGGTPRSLANELTRAFALARIDEIGESDDLDDLTDPDD